MIESLLKRKCTVVALISNPGNGKSLSVVEVLVELLLKLRSGVDVGFKSVYYKLGKFLHQFKYDAGSKKFVVEHCVSGSFETMASKITSAYDVWLVELQEKEQETIDLEDAICRVYITFSSRDVTKVLKGSTKGDQATIFVYGMRSWEEIYAMGLAELDICPDTCKWAKAEDGSMLSRDEALTKLMVTNTKAGPIPRACFGSEENYNASVDAMETSISDVMTQISGKTVSVTNLPPGAALYFGTVVRPGVVDPKLHYSYAAGAKNDTYGTDKKAAHLQFVSDYAMDLVAAKAKLPREINQLNELHLTSQMMEAVARRGLALKSKTDDNFDALYKVSEWKAYVDFGSNRLVEEFQYDMDVLRSHLRVCEEEVLYSDKHWSYSVDQLKDKVLYRSIAADHHLFDFLVKSGNDVFLVQVSQSEPNEHSFKMAVLENVWKNLGLNDQANQKYRVTYVYVTDSASKVKHLKGIELSAEGIKYGKTVEVKKGLLEWGHEASVETPEWLGRVSSVVVRATFYPILKRTPVQAASILTVTQWSTILKECFGETISKGNFAVVFNR